MCINCKFVIFNISIHSLRMEGDKVLLIEFVSLKHFNPLPPHGGRLTDAVPSSTLMMISIHSLRMEGDDGGTGKVHGGTISIHSLRMEGDLLFRSFSHILENFNPLPPHGGRLSQLLSGFRIPHFNPLPPHGGRPPSALWERCSFEISIHSLRMEGD